MEGGGTRLMWQVKAAQICVKEFASLELPTFTPTFHTLAFREAFTFA